MDDSEGAFTEAELYLAELAEAPTDQRLAEIAAHQDMGDTPLLGTRFRAQTYPALLWNGERFERLGAPWPARLAFMAGVAAGETADRFRLTRSVQLGESLRGLWPQPAEAPAAGLTTDSVAAAVCAAVAAGVEDSALEAVAETAASLMLVTPAVLTADLRESGAGHALASGWLALMLLRSGVVAAPGTSGEVLQTREAP
jgi:hypothetical protein